MIKQALLPLLGFLFLSSLCAQTINTNIKVDQFGYRPSDPKVAVISNPITGFNSADEFIPGSSYEVRRAGDNTTAFSGSIVQWNGGQTMTQCGDQGWWFDFSALTEEGSYYIYDATNNAISYEFEISETVYFEVLKAATKMLFLNRCNFAKTAPYVDANWQDGVAFSGTLQDTESRYVYDQGNASLEKNLFGGWFDAGDYNKYVTFAESTIHQLLEAYTQNPAVWTDNFEIPESGNGLPDLLDEIKWELDWMMRMQDTNDGGVIIKMGDLDYNSLAPPSADTDPRVYGPKCSSSTIGAASCFAHAAIIYEQFPAWASYADSLRARAELAWDWYQANPQSTSCDDGTIKSGDADVSLGDQDQLAVVTAVYLFALTGNTTYNNYVIANNGAITAPGWWGPYNIQYGEALLYYATLAGADAGLANSVNNAKVSNSSWNTDFYRFYPNQDLYRAYMPDAQYHWGSSFVKTNTGLLNVDMLNYNLDAGNSAQYTERALASINYMHGVNAFNLVYLSNMYDYGAESSCNEIYHSWFNDGTDWDNALTSLYGPGPGFVSGGPNKDFGGTTPNITNQPPQKAYKDYNAGYPENSWELTEPSISYQASYIKLLSKFTSAPPECLNLEVQFWLGGPYDSASDLMSNNLYQMDLLPSGQPYDQSPWNYSGLEGEGWTNSDYPNQTADWFLLGLRSSPSSANEVEVAGLVLSDGTTQFPESCILLDDLSGTDYYIAIEHRNHMGIMSPTSISVNANSLSHDFRVQDSYKNPTSIGQREIEPGVWAMLAGDFDQNDAPSYDINGADKEVWSLHNGSFGIYHETDANFDGDINGGDKEKLILNFGNFSAVPK